MTESKKAQKLIELVRGKTVLREAPTRRDVILTIYGIDIDDTNNKDYEKYFVKIKFNALLRNIREREKKRLKDPYDLHNHNENQFHMIEDEETKKWHCVHIIQSINGDYLLKWGRRMEKYIATHKRITENVLRAAMLSEEQREALKKDEIRGRWARSLSKQHCTPKQIRAYIRELRKDGRIKEDSNYRPNIKGIQHVFGDNAGQVKYAAYKYWEDSTGNWVDGSVKKSLAARKYQNEDELIKGVTKEIVMCDYNKTDYHLPDPNKPDFLNLGLH